MGAGWAGSRQNLEPQGLAARIFWNKDLDVAAEGTVEETLLEELSSRGASPPFLKFSVEVVRHTIMGFLLWKTWNGKEVKR
jgi:hypothetical protein